MLCGCRPSAPALDPDEESDEGRHRHEAGAEADDRCEPAPELEEKLEVATGLIPVPRALATDEGGRVGSQVWRQALPTVIARATDARSVSVGNRHACALLQSGSVRCWTQPGLPHGVMPQRQSLVRMVEMPAFSDVKQVVVGRAYGPGDDLICLLLGSGSVTCMWADDDVVHEPNLVRGLHDAVQVELSLSQGLACAITQRGTVACWGEEFQLQRSGFVPGESREAVEHRQLKGVTRVAPGQDFVCALGEGARCTFKDAASATWLDSLGPVRDLAVGDGWLCALTLAEVQCRESRARHAGFAPVQRFERAPEIRRLAVGIPMACALYADGHVACLDNAGLASVDEPMPHKSDTPVTVPGLVATDLDVGGSACAVTSGGQVACWGFMAAVAAFEECVPPR